jgi:hypothetical protein
MSSSDVDDEDEAADEDAEFVVPLN